MSTLSVMLGLPILHAVKSYGRSVRELLERLRIPESLLEDPDNRMDARLFDRLMEAAAETCADPCFGLRLGASYSLDRMGIVGYVLLNSGTLRQAYENYERYNALLCSGVIYELKVGDGEAVFRFGLSDSSRNPSYHLLDSIASSTWNVLQRLSGESLRPIRAEFRQGKPADASPYAELFGTSLAFGRDVTELAFDARMLDMPVVYHSPQLLQEMEKLAAEMIRSLKLARTFTETVSHAIMRRFDGTVPRIGDVCRSLGVSVRLLQLRLQQENTTYKELLATIRRNMAERLLTDRSVPIGDIAYALGFSSPAAFHNAFKLWTGQTAGSFRKAAIEACGE